MNVLIGKRILITGGAGFVGSYITEQLLEEGASEIVIVDNFFRGSKENIQHPLRTGKVRLVVGDIRDEAMQAGVTPDKLKGADDDYLRDMDYGISKDAEKVRAALDPYVPGIKADDAVKAILRGRPVIWMRNNNVIISAC